MGGSLMNAEVWRVAHASAIGVSHLEQKTECQDRFACKTIKTNADGEVLVAVVADGAGSTSHGQHGAQKACELFIEQIVSFLNAENISIESITAEFGTRWLEYFQRKIVEMAEKEKKTPRDFATTLVAAVAGEKCAVFFQIGDGGIVISTSGAAKSYRFALPPHESEYVNLTDFLTDVDANEKLKFAKVDEKIEDIILFSDGIYSVAVDYQTNQPHEPFLMPMIAPLRNSQNLNGLNTKLENFLASPKLNEKTDDDKTIILASRAKLKTVDVSA